MRVFTGLENLNSETDFLLKGKKLGLLANPASVTQNLTHAKDVVYSKFGKNLRALFSPQHGFYAEKQDNMILSDNIMDKDLNIPVYSLYGESLKPKKEMLEDIDVLLIDIQDVGTRVYTFIYTISYCLEAAKENNVKVVILDRPNPVSGDRFEGNILEQEYSSFVGRYKIPMRHGLTTGEFALFINNEFNINADLDVIKLKNWKRDTYFDKTGLPWILPSPNLPTFESALVYPGQVIFEGTNISEARGTTKPFEFFGAPFIERKKLKEFIYSKYNSDGVFLRDIVFQPTSGKWADTPCRGFQIHVEDRDKYQSYFLSLCILQGLITLFKDKFQWKMPPYEFEYEKMPIDLILGSKKLREDIENGKDLNLLRENWMDDLENYKTQIKDYLLY